MGATLLLDEPFDEAVSQAADVPAVLPVAVNGRAYLIDTKQYKRSTLPALRVPNDPFAEPSESSLATEGPWRRNQVDWTLGAGQDWLDDQDSTRKRFRTSKGCDPWTKRSLHMLPAAALHTGSSSSESEQHAITAGDFMVWSTGHTVNWRTLPNGVATGANVGTTSVNPVTSMTWDGRSVYMARADGLWSWAPTTAGTFDTQFSTQATDRVAYTNGRLVGTYGPQVFEFHPDGTTTLIWTHPNPAFSFACLSGSPLGIYLGGNAGGRCNLYIISEDASTGALKVPIPVGELPYGETVNDIRYYQGLVYVASSRGVRLADITNNGFVRTGALSLGSLIAIGNVECLEPDGNYVWFGWTNFDFSYTANGITVTDSGSTGLGRIWPARFTDAAAFIPAYASDLMVGDSITPVRGRVTSILSFLGKRYFTVSGYGLVAEQDAQVTTAKMACGRVSYDTVEAKQLIGGELRHDPLPSGAVIDLSVESESGTLFPTAHSTEVTGHGVNALVPSATQAMEWGEPILTLTRSSTAPVLRRWTVRSVITPLRYEEIILPLLIRTHVRAGQGDGWSKGAADTFDDFLFLRSLVISRRPVDYQEGNAVYRVIVDQMQVEPDKGWNDTKSWFEATVTLRLLTVEGT